MPVRAVLNALYALLVKNLDAKERKEFDDSLYALTEVNKRAEKVLWGMT